MDFDRWLADQGKAMAKPAEEPNWNPDEWLGDQHPELQARLLEMRGGCRCCICPPCGACVEPITDDEAASLGLIPHPPTNEHKEQ